MVIQPKVRGFICTTAHPEGCFQNVKAQIDYVKQQPKNDGPKNVLVIGASTGYGLASRIAAAYCYGASTIGVIFDKPSSEKRTATAGWYNTAAFETIAKTDGLYAKTINGDAFSDEVKNETISLIKKDLGKVDMVIYSLASPRRTMPDGTVYHSVLKTTNAPYQNKTIDLRTKEITQITIEPATEDEIEATIRVMGGEDWKLWIDALKKADAITENAITLAYSYIGPQITHPMYYEGSIGMAKKDLYHTANKITDEGIRAYISVNKALVTQSSAAIPIVPLYISILYKVMKEANLHEGCMEQMYRLFAQKLNKNDIKTDEQNMIRLDDWEMLPRIQNKVTEIWNIISQANLDMLSDIDGYWKEFYQMFGFEINGIDYQSDIEPSMPIPSISE